MKTIKNKLLHSIGETHSQNDDLFLALRSSCLSLLAQQKIIFKNLEKQEIAMKYIGISNLSATIRKGGNPKDPLIPLYDACAVNVDRLVVDHEGKANDTLRTLAVYLKTKKHLKEKLQERENLLVALDLAMNEYDKALRQPPDPEKRGHALLRVETKRKDFEIYHGNLCAEMQTLLDCKGANFDAHVKSILDSYKTLFKTISKLYVLGGLVPDRATPAISPPSTPPLTSSSEIPLLPTLPHLSRQANYRYSASPSHSPASSTADLPPSPSLSHLNSISSSPSVSPRSSGGFPPSPSLSHMDSSASSSPSSFPSLTHDPSSDSAPSSQQESPSSFSPSLPASQKTPPPVPKKPTSRTASFSSSPSPAPRTSVPPILAPSSPRSTPNLSSPRTLPQPPPSTLRSSSSTTARSSVTLSPLPPSSPRSLPPTPSSSVSPPSSPRLASSPSPSSPSPPSSPSYPLPNPFARPRSSTSPVEKK